MLQVENLTKHYGRLTAVDKSVIFSLRGRNSWPDRPNGAGKTTVFECLGAVRPADDLQVLHDHRPFTGNELRSTLFYLPDAITPWPAQSVNWALDFVIGFLWGRRELRDDVIHRLDLTSLLSRPMGSLSKGQLKRALLAIGLLMPQPLLVADEPFEGMHGMN